MAQLSQMRVAPVAGIRPGVRNFRLDVCLQLHVLDVNSERDLATAFAGARDCPPHLSRDVLAKIMQRPDSSGRPPMKAFGAALVAAAILYVVDAEYNDGRYTQVIQQVMTSMRPN